MAHVPTPAAPELNCTHQSAANGIVLEEIAESGDSAKVHIQHFPPLM
jgi:hypothetical protein